MKKLLCLIALIVLTACDPEPTERGEQEQATLDGYWYEHPLRIQQTVLREIDAIDYNVDSVIAYLKKIHANVLVINGGGIVDFFQNTLPLANVNEYMGERDLLAEVVQACHDNGIKVIARVDFRGVHKNRYEQHPDWFAENENGDPIILTWNTPLLYAPCYNSYYRNEHAVQFISTLFEKYKVDGIWHNAVNFHNTCYGERCQQQFFEYSGKRIPTENSPEEDWEEYYKWKAKDADEQLTLMRETVKKYGDDKAYTAEVFNMFNVEQQKHTGIDLYSAANFFDFLVTVSFIADNRADVEYKDLSYGASIIKFLKSLKPDKSPVILFGGNGTEHRYIYDPPVDLRQWLWEAAGNGGGFWNCYFNGSYPANTIDTRNAYLPEDSYAYQAKNERLIQGLQPVKDIGIFYSKASAQLLGDEEFSHPIRGMIRMLEEAHLQFSFISDYELTESSLDEFKVLILPNVVYLTDEQNSLIREWVHDGGQLIATHKTSLYNNNGIMRADFKLGDLFGCSSTGSVADTHMDCYQVINERTAVLDGFEKTDLIHNGGETLICKLNPGAIAVTGYLPKINNQPPELAYPTDWEWEFPIIVQNEYGRGKVIYFANQPGKLNHMTGHPDYHQTMVNALGYLLGDHISLSTNAPESVHIYLNRSRKNPSIYQLSLVNVTSGPHRPLRVLVPVRNIEIELPFEMTSCEVISGDDPGIEIRGNTLFIERLEEFCSFRIEG